jgi:large subunit ribosomal protein L15
MNELSNLKPPAGAVKKPKRIGRGPASGSGKTSGRGQKGQHARSSDRVKSWFEGGQMPLQRRAPKRGFTNIFRQEFVAVNVHQLNRFEDDAVVDVQSLLDAGLVKNLKTAAGVKLLGNGTLERKLTVKVDKASKTAIEKVKALGGRIEVTRGE